MFYFQWPNTLYLTSIKEYLKNRPLPNSKLMPYQLDAMRMLTGKG